MQKFLYITDQNEYSDNSFIGPLFEKYLTKHYDIDIIYFSKFKGTLEKKDNNKIIIPLADKLNVLEVLENNGINLKDYAYVAVRNDTKILKEVIKRKNIYGFKVAFRLSFPKRIAKLQMDEANNKKSYFDIISNKIQLHQETSLINDCDIFLPTTRKMRDKYLKDVKTRTFIIPSAIDPEVLHHNIQHEGEEKRFFYAGTLDKLREFETVLDAFSQLSSGSFKIMISTKDPEYAQNLLAKYSTLRENIELYNATTKEELLALIAKADIGLSILPDIQLFNTSTPVKIMDYYASAVPCLMSKNDNNLSIFEDNKTAWLCDFDKDSIKTKLEEIIKLSKDEVALIGDNGQHRLLDIRNYKRIADDLAHQLNVL
ncbi:MAG: glycosyltransferase [Arcobacter sp.]|uniref:glycosyltransferase n=1 Tax=Arcobacter sp. TaxID=1872629 RepID=UPI003B00223A